MTDQTPKKLQTVEDLIRAQHKVEETVKESFKSIEPYLSDVEKVHFPNFNSLEMPTLEDYTLPEVTREQNAWERHTEMLEVQNAVLQIQKEILGDQRRNKKYMIIGLILSGLAAIFSAVPIWDSVRSLPKDAQSVSAEDPVQESAYNYTTERFAGQIDRVAVVFEQEDYIRYRLTTNGLVREGELNTERGFEDDENATVYVLNWQAPEGEQMRYVRHTKEPDRLYLIDSAGKIVTGSSLERK